MAPDSAVSIQGGVVDRGRFPPGLNIGGGGDGSSEVDGRTRHPVIGGRWW
jgi:hypothetical protein